MNDPCFSALTIMKGKAFMKKTTAVLVVLFMVTALFAGCSGSPKADFEDPQAVVDALLAEYSLEGDNVVDVTGDFAGKTVSIKTNERDDPIVDIYKKVTLTTGLYVILVDSYSSSGNRFDYNVGDTVVMEIAEIMFRAYKDGAVRDIFISVKPLSA